MSLHQTPISHRHLWVILTSAGLAAMVDWLFFQHTAGVSVAMFLLVLLAMLVWRGRGAMRRLDTRVLLVATLGLAASLANEPGPVNLFLALLSVVLLASAIRSPVSIHVGDWVNRWVQMFAIAWAKPFVDMSLVQRYRSRRGMRRGRLLLRIGAWLLPLGLGGVFVLLFAIANPVIETWFSDAGEHIQQWWTFTKLAPPERWMLWIAASMAAYALFRVRAKRGVFSAPAVPMGAIRRPLTIGRCLIVFNLVFAMQSGLDAIYLWGGASLPDGMTYAAYARRGAYPLVATALLAAAFVLVTFAPGKQPMAMKFARRLVLVWLAQNVFLTINAAWRLWLYVDVYSLTRLRFAAGVWMAIVALGLIWIVWRIVADRSNAWLLRVNALTVISMLYGLSFVNVDACIAGFNVARCREMSGAGPSIDMGYLRRLGPDAIPALCELAADANDDSTRVDASFLVYSHRIKLDRQLENWRGWTWRRHRLSQYLSEREAVVNQP